MEKEKKEIGKLLELYRNYLTDEIKKEMYVNGADKECIDMFEADEVEEERLYKFLNQLSVLKKFVKWLVENDKIDLGLYREYMPNLGEDFSVENNIIMNLSIAIDPIGYLNYILK